LALTAGAAWLAIAAAYWPVVSFYRLPSAWAAALPLAGALFLAMTWSSAIGYSFTKVDNTNFQEVTAFHKGEYASANLLYSPFENVLTGVEFLWGKRTDNDGEKGTDARMQASFKWSFSSKNIWDLLAD